MTTDDPNEADESLLDCIKTCLGARLSKLELLGCSDASFERIAKLMEVKFEVRATHQSIRFSHPRSGRGMREMSKRFVIFDHKFHKPV